MWTPTTPLHTLNGMPRHEQACVVFCGVTADLQLWIKQRCLLSAAAPQPHVMSGQAMAPTAQRNSAMARWYCAPPYSRMCALGSPSGIGSAPPSGPTNAPAPLEIVLWLPWLHDFLAVKLVCCPACRFAAATAEQAASAQWSWI
jgi:hypothetical protein